MRQTAALAFDFFGAIGRHLRERPDQIALQLAGKAGSEAISWRHLNEEVRALSCWLRDAGVAPGDRVAIFMENGPRWGVAFCAIQSAGAIAVPLDTIGGAAQAAANAEHAEAKLMISSPTLAEAAAAICAAAPSLRGMIASETDWRLAVSGLDSSTPLPLVPRTPEDPLAILYTGGTTGQPKGVLLLQRNLHRSIADMLRIFPLSPADRVLSVLPLFHIMPLLANLLAPLYTGASVIFLNQLDPQSLTDTFVSSRITAFLCVPQFYYQIERRIREEISRQSSLKRSLFHFLLVASGFIRSVSGLRAGALFFKPVHARFGPSLRAFGIGGAYFNPRTARFFADLGFPLFQAYGLTESGGLATATPLNREGGFTCGPAVANCELRINNPDAAGTGEILIRGENVMAGYWRDPEATAHVICDGWLHTGDLGTIDAQGALRLTGRAKDVIVLSSGKNVFPEEIELFFMQRCASLREVCMVGMETADGTALHCVAVSDQAADSVRREIAVAARDLPGYRRPRSLHVASQPLPRTTTRKLQRFRVAQLAASEPKRDSIVTATPEPADPIERDVAKLLRRARPAITAIPRDFHLELDLQLDSLERVELIANVERGFGIEIDAEQSARIHTFGDLVDTVAQKSSSRTAAGAEWTDWTDLVRLPLTAEERQFAAGYLRRRPVPEILWYGFGRFLALLLRLTMRLKIRCAGTFPDGPFLLCPNHLSYLDDPVIACSLPLPVFRRVFAVASTKYFRGPVASWLISLFRILPIDEDRNLLKGLRRAKAGLEGGLNLIIFPEGTRSFDGRLQELRKGASILACSLGVPVVPVGLSGTFESWPRGQMFPRPHPVAISYGTPLVPMAGETPDAFGIRLAAAMAQEIATAGKLRGA